MEKILSLGKILNKQEQKKIVGGYGGNCKSTCWAESTGGKELGYVAVADCGEANSGKCKDTYPDAKKATCSCG